MQELSIKQVSQVAAGDSPAGEGLLVMSTGFGLALAMGTAITATALLPAVIVAVGGVMVGNAIYDFATDDEFKPL